MENMPNEKPPAETTVPQDPVEQHPEYWRYHIPHDRFTSLLWKHMNQLGWIHNSTSRKYQAPPKPDGTPGQIFDSANAVTDYLNSFAVSNVYTNLQWADDYDSRQVIKDNDAMKDREIGLALRRAILQRIYEKNKGDLDNDERVDSSAMTGHNDDPDDTDAGKQSSNGVGTRRSSRGTATRTVTAMEKGADLYLRRRTKGRSQKKTAAPSTSSKKGTSQRQRLSVKECQEFLETYPMEEVEQLEETYHAQFSKWRFLLSTNHSLLFYGAGSKRELLNSFAAEELYKEGKSLVIDGTDDDVTVDGLLDVLVHVFLDGKEPADLAAVQCQPNHVPVTGKFCPWKADAVVDRAIMIGRGLAHQVEGAEQPMSPAFLVIHNIDARLATPVAQEALSALVTNSTVANGVASLRLLASVDHVDAPTFLWDPVTEANFSWFPCCVHTHRPFTHELKMIEEDGANRKKTARASRTNTQARRVLDVLRNLAPRHTEVVQLLAQLQAGSQEGWIDYLKYRDRCKTACAINKDSQLRSLLTELKDHGLVVTKTEGPGEFVQIPFSSDKLQEIIDFERDA